MKKLSLLFTALMSLNASAVKVEIANDLIVTRQAGRCTGQTYLRDSVVQTTVSDRQITLLDAVGGVLYRQTFDEDIESFEFDATVKSVAIENVANPLSLFFGGSQTESIDLKVDTRSENITLAGLRPDHLKSFSYGGLSFDPGMFQFAFLERSAPLTIKDLQEVILSDMRIQEQKEEIQKLEESLQAEKNNMINYNKLLDQKRWEVEALQQENKVLLEQQGVTDILQYQEKIKSIYFGPLQPQSEDEYRNAPNQIEESIEEIKKAEKDVQKRIAEKRSAIFKTKFARIGRKILASASFIISLADLRMAFIIAKMHGYTFLTALKMGAYAISALQMNSAFK